MKLSLESLEIRYDGSQLGLSARRLWEHTELGQKNVFGQSISRQMTINDVSAFIDVIWFEDNEFYLIGISLRALRQGQFSEHLGLNENSFPLGIADASPSLAFVRIVAEHLAICSNRVATRNSVHLFLPSANRDDTFDVPFLFSMLKRRLRMMGGAKARVEQWRNTIENLQKKGLRAEELERSNLMSTMESDCKRGQKIGATELVDLCDFSALRLSVIPVLRDAQVQLRFTSVPKTNLKKAKKLPKAQTGQVRAVVGFDPVLGYRVERIEHESLWGKEHHWQAVTHDGAVIDSSPNRTLLSSQAEAKALAASHATECFPKRVTLGRWSHIAWTGGDEYREWLITLPYFPATYFSSHFEVRNVLAHVRCDVREGADGERVLLLQEVQSDWAQNVRRAISAGEMASGDVECPPFLKEWAALAMKLVLLYAAHRGLGAVAWTRGSHQVLRYRGLGATGLVELYDRTLPREVNRICKPLGQVCETLGVFVPTNFSIRQSERGYDVYTAENELLGTASTLEDARQFVPDGGHELLYDVHGIRLPEAVRTELLEKGLPAWG
jgi:hypothetical protein